MHILLHTEPQEAFKEETLNLKVATSTKEVSSIIDGASKFSISSKETSLLNEDLRFLDDDPSSEKTFRGCKTHYPIDLVIFIKPCIFLFLFIWPRNESKEIG